jgi:hypothetical protein
MTPKRLGPGALGAHRALAIVQADAHPPGDFYSIRKSSNLTFCGLLCVS